MYNVSKYFLGGVIAGLSTIVFNRLLYTVFIEKHIEKNELHPICKNYRSTYTNIFAMFVAAFIIYFFMTFGIYKLIQKDK
jgi:hypothetical protein